ncbi:MAG TPA: Mpo1-like protein, partial [Lysobacter sp.]
MNATTDRPIDRWFASYSGDHRNETNQLIHVVCVPAILWSVVALLWCIPVPEGLLLPGAWAALAMFAAWMFYYRASKPLGLGMLAMFVLMGFL